MVESLIGLLPEGFKFLRPAWFWALLPVAGLVVALLLRRQRGASWSRVCDAHLLPHLLTDVERKRTIWPLFLLVPAWFAAVVALAGPVWQQLPQPVFESEEARVFVLDLSRSMDATDLSPSRLARAKFKLLDLLKRSGEGQTGLVVFAGDAFVVSPLTQDANTIAAMVPALQTTIMPVQGSRADLALRKADALFEQGQAPEGEIILIADGVNAVAIDVAREIADRGRRVSVLALGTTQGAPIPVQVGGFLKDRNGGIVIPKLDLALLSEVAAAGDGLFTMMRSDDSDVELLTTQHEVTDWSDGEQHAELKTESWREEGPWLLLAILPFALLAFRRGALVCLVAVVLYLGQPGAAMAVWDELWLNPDQQGARLLAEDRPKEAAERFRDPAWQANAYYRAGDYEKAAQLFEQIDTPTGHYNRANALAKLGRLDEALAEYDKALATEGGAETVRRDAEFNRELVKKLREQQRQQQPEAGEAGPSDAGAEDSQDPQTDDAGQEQPGQGDDQSGAPSSGTASGESSDEGSEQGQESQSSPQSAEERSAESQQAIEEASEERGGDSETAANDDAPSSESEQAVEQWLRRVPDDPGGLLRRKFLYQYQRQQSEGNSQQADEAW